MSDVKPKWGGAPSDKCTGCGKTVYPAEKLLMQDQIWHIDCLKCVECGKKLSGANWGGFVPPDNKAYCKVHHDRLVASMGSSVAISGSTGTWTPKTTTTSSSSGTSSPKYGGGAVENCTGCGKRVYVAEKLMMEGQIWHIDCLKCVECSKKLTGGNWGGFVPPDNKAYCKVHHDRLVAAAGSSVGISGSVGTWSGSGGSTHTTSTTSTAPTPSSSSGGSEKPKTTPKYGGAPSEKCTGCGKTVYPAERVSMEGFIYHNTCLRCVEVGCNKMITGANWGGFVPPDNKAYCKIHYDRLVAAKGNAIEFSHSIPQKPLSKT